MRLSRERLALGAATALVAWGALAFGAVYPWAYVPLAAAAALTGVVGLSSRVRAPALAPFAWGLALVAIAVSIQLVPLPASLLARVSPGTDAFLQNMNLGYAILAAEGAVRHPISIAPGHTALGLALFCAFAVFALGLMRALSVTGVRAGTVAILALGVALAIAGIAQLAVYPDPTTENPARIYGFWTPERFSFPFGPFINRNHFAGWMLMTLPLGLGLFYDALQRILQEAPSHRRDPLALLGSPQAGTLLSAGAAVLLMGLSLVMTRSRSGLGAFAVGSMVAAWVVLRRQPTMKRRIIAAGCFAALLAATATWAGVDTVVGKFADDEQPIESIAGRRTIWADASRIVRDFPSTGSGLNTFGTAMIAYQSGTPDVHYFEAHNDYLQIAAEGGLLVGVPAAIAILLLVLQVRRRFADAPKVGTTYWIRVGAVVGMVSVALQSVFEFSLQMPGNAAMLAMLAAIALHESPSMRGSRSGHAVGSRRRASHADHESGR